MARLFGTDGVRGVANTELTCDLAFKIGQAAARVIREITDVAPVFTIGKDTRISSDMLGAAVSAGICSSGGKVLDCGVIPTPAIAYLTKQYNADAGIVISASHNPFEHNGIKIFSAQGYKLNDELEDKIEELIKENKFDNSCYIGANIGYITVMNDAVERYVSYLAETAAVIRRDIKVVIDCSNGAASPVIASLVKSLGISAKIINATPDGLNINLNCGSTHLDALAKAVKAHKAHLGIAFDGDADRMLAVDENGKEIDGDFLIALFAVGLKKRGVLRNNAVAVTTMSNLGFFEAMKNNGIETSVTDVGDKYVLRRMLEQTLSIGGEKSGHIIFGDITTTGDGMLAAVKLLELLSEERRPLSECAAVMTQYPQVLVGTRVPASYKSKYKDDAILQKAIAKAQEGLGNNGRILVRASGTEPLIRVMVEGKNLEEIKDIAQSIIGIIDLNSAK